MKRLKTNGIIFLRKWHINVKNNLCKNDKKSQKIIQLYKDVCRSVILFTGGPCTGYRSHSLCTCSTWTSLHRVLRHVQTCSTLTSLCRPFQTCSNFFNHDLLVQGSASPGPPCRKFSKFCLIRRVLQWWSIRGIFRYFGKIPM